MITRQVLVAGGAPRPAPAAVVSISGGVAGVEAEWAAGRALADELDTAADAVRGRARLGPRVLADPDLIASVPVSPLTFAAAERAVLAATLGPRGVLGCGLSWEADAVAVRAATAGMQAADVTAREAVELRDYALGRIVAGIALPAVAIAAPRVAAGWLALPPGVRRHLVDRLGPAASAGLQRSATSHPRAVETLFNTAGGLVDGILLSPPRRLGTPQAADTMAALYDDGRPVVRERPDIVLPPTSRVAARDLTELIGALAGVAALSGTPTSPLNGTIAVATLRGPGGTRHVVYLPGTDDLATTPWSQDHDVRDMGTNLDLVARRPTSYGAGVLQAMGRAGIGRHEPVLLVGHSQGGMQAAALAASDPPYEVTDVVTAGSPVAQVDLPDDVRVLSLENHGDVVPLTDGEPNRPSVGHVTVTVEAGGEGIVGHHDYDRYAAAAAAADSSDDPSVRAALARLNDRGFLGSTGSVEVETRVFQVTRR